MSFPGTSCARRHRAHRGSSIDQFPRTVPHGSIETALFCLSRYAQPSPPYAPQEWLQKHVQAEAAPQPNRDIMEFDHIRRVIRIWVRLYSQ